MRKFSLLSLLLLAFAFIATNCTKEGPEGPAGATGAQGPAGAAGTPGTPGAPGAGVTTYSPWFTTVAADWQDSYAPPYWALWGFQKAAPGVTQAIMDNGVVLAYMKNWTYYDDVTDGPLKNANTVVQLPYKVDIDFQDLYDYAIPAPGTIDFLYKSGFQTWFDTDIAGTSFRYVIIPGSVAGGKSPNSGPTFEGYTKDQLKAMTYEQVAAIFKIPATGSNIQ
jgi:hypothetical protein